MNKSKRCIGSIIEVLLMFSIIIAVLSIFFKMVVLNKNTYTNILDKSNAYEQIKESIYSKIDAVLSAKNINFDIKESIITEDDLKREADNAVSGIIEYLETGENNIKPVDADVYKKRVATIVHSTISNIIKPTSNSASINDGLSIQNTASRGNKIKFNEMIIVKKKSEFGQDVLNVEKLMSREEAEAKVRELLRQKGLTEEQAIQKATEKGLTEEQALDILAGYGITIDEEPKDSEVKKEAAGSNESHLDNNSSSSDNDNNIQEEKSKGATEDANITNGAAKSQIDKLEDKLLEEANSAIDKEIEKFNLSKILESDKIQKIARLTAAIYKMFWLIFSLPIALMVMLIIINKKHIRFGLKQIGRSFLVAGLIINIAVGGPYAFKLYEKININSVYVKDIMSYSIKHFSMVLLTYGIITCVIGLLIVVTGLRKTRNESKKNYI